MSSEITVLAYELTYQRYLMNKGKAKRLFGELSIQEYVALHSIMGSRAGGMGFDTPERAGQEKIYLSELAERMDITIHRASKMIRDLKERGLVTQSHDGNGSEGTYITLTDEGERMIREQDKILEVYYSRVIEKFGQDKLVSLLRQMDELEEIMDSEFDGMEESDDTDESD